MHIVIFLQLGCFRNKNLFDSTSHWVLAVLLASMHYSTMKFSIKDFFSKCDQIPIKLRIWSRLLKKFLMENFIFCAVTLLLS